MKIVVFQSFLPDYFVLVPKFRTNIQPSSCHTKRHNIKAEKNFIFHYRWNIRFYIWMMRKLDLFIYSYTTNCLLHIYLYSHVGVSIFERTKSVVYRLERCKRSYVSCISGCQSVVFGKLGVSKVLPWALRDYNSIFIML